MDITKKDTAQKFQNIPVTQILREIKFGGPRSSKTTFLATLGALKCVNLANFRLQKVQKSINM